MFQTNLRLLQALHYRVNPIPSAVPTRDAAVSEHGEHLIVLEEKLLEGYKLMKIVNRDVCMSGAEKVAMRQKGKEVHGHLNLIFSPCLLFL